MTEPMSADDVPDELVRAAVKARVAAIASRPPEEPRAFVAEIRAILAAVLKMANQVARSSAYAERDQIREERDAARAEVELMQKQVAQLGIAEVEQRIVTPAGLIYPLSARDLDARSHWLPGVRLEQRIVYGTPWREVGGDDGA